MVMRTEWACIAQARQQPGGARVPFLIDGEAVGSVAHANLSVLRAWPGVLCVEDGAVDLLAPAGERSAVLADINRQLRAQGRILAWRDEAYPLRVDDGPLLAVIERASARFWGTLTFGAHCTGYLADESGRPTHLWIARRALDKATDPGRLDNLVGGGVPLGQSPREALQREAWEEAGLRLDELADLQPGRTLSLDCDVAEGRQREWLYAYDLKLPPGRVPQNQDGEVAEHRLMPVAEALAHAAGGDMTLDAALVTLDFALRHGLLPADTAAALEARCAALWVRPALAARLDPR
ncbi:DUF4743 domain-containing protein [Ideonella sp.]|uniref:NUDIX hydrolase n=1 Tax=Ideonella sp. TaxID=1929293 RepID=UPI003BB787EB